ncbi:MAG: ABC transporter substrate-binding protein [Thermodesulfobacteriota bacterium]
MKRTSCWVLIIGLLISLGMLGCAEKEENVVKVGAVFPITGNIAQFGNYWKQGLELALYDAINQGVIPKDKIKLIIEDGQADPRKSVDAFKKLVEVDKVVACIPATSGVTLALKPIANQNKIVLINASAISTEIEDAPDYVFSVIPNAKFTGYFLAETAFNKLGKRNAGVLYRDDASGKSFLDNFSKRFKELGGNIVFVDSHEPNATDFRTNIAKIKNVKNMDVIFVASWGTDVAYYLRQATELGVHTQVLAYETFYTPKVLEIAGSSANGVIFSAPEFNAWIDEPRLKEFREKVLKKYNQKEINYHIAGHYDAMMLILKAISAGNMTGETIKNYLSGMRSFQGITGEIRFDNNGGAQVPLSLFTVRNEKFSPYLYP